MYILIPKLAASFLINKLKVANFRGQKDDVGGGGVEGRGDEKDEFLAFWILMAYGLVLWVFIFGEVGSGLGGGYADRVFRKFESIRSETKMKIEGIAENV